MRLMNRKDMILNRNKVRSKSEACTDLRIWTFTKVYRETILVNEANFFQKEWLHAVFTKPDNQN